MKRLSSMIVLCCLLFPIPGIAQERVISGKVTAADNGSPLPGVTVQLKGTNTGTTTDPSGNFRITVNSPKPLLVFSYVGHLTKEISPAGNTLSISLEVDARNLEGVVVTALGIKKEKRALGYAVQDVGSAELSVARQSNVVNALQGKVAGVQISSTGGAPGQGSRIIIRGINSLDPNRSNQPLFIIDGIPMDNETYTTGGAETRGMSNRGADINPDDVESISILRGGAATALYGLRASNGAVVITTKAGKAGRLRVSYTGSYGIDEVNKFPEVQSKFSQGFLNVYDAASFWPSFGPKVEDAKALDPTHPAALFNHYSRGYGQGNQFRNTVSLSGGSEKMLFAASLSHFDQDGVMPFSNYSNYSAKVNGELKFSPKFRMGTSLNYINSGGLRANADRYNEQLTYWSPRHDLRDYTIPVYGTMKAYGETDNPIYTLFTNRFKDNVNRVIASTNFTYSPTSWLDVNYRVGVDWYTDARTHTAPGPLRTPGEVVNGDNGDGFIDEYVLNKRTLNSTFLLNFKNKISSRLTSDLKVGHDLYETKLKRTSTEGDTLDIPTLFILQNAKRVTATQYQENYRIIGLFADWTLDWDNYLYLSLTGRNDWSSTLPVESRSFFYPSASLGYIFSEHLKTPALSYGKLRASWARIGKDATPYQIASGYSPLSGGPIGSSIGWTRGDLLGDPGLKPEFTTTFEAGVEARFLNNRLGVDFTWYTSKSKDLLITVLLPVSSGSENFYTNSGSMQNRGVELTLSGTPVTSKNFNWDVKVNFSANRNKVLSLRPGLPEVVVATHFGYLTSAATQKYVPGYPVGAIYGTSYARYYGTAKDEDNLVHKELPLIIQQTGANRGFPQVNTKQRYLGNSQPKWIGSISNNFRYKDFNLSFLFDVRQGVVKYNQFANFMAAFGIAKFTENRTETTTFTGVYAADGSVNNMPVYLGQGLNGGRDYGNGYYRNVYRGSTENFIEDASWVRLRNVSLSYALPKNMLSKTKLLTDASITLTGNNLWLHTKYSGYDPEASSFNAGSNVDAFAGFTYPSVRSYMVTLNVSF